MIWCRLAWTRHQRHRDTADLDVQKLALPFRHCAGQQLLLGLLKRRRLAHPERSKLSFAFQSPLGCFEFQLCFFSFRPDQLNRPNSQIRIRCEVDDGGGGLHPGPPVKLSPTARLTAALASRLPITQRHAAKRSAGCSFIHAASSGAPIRQDCTETSAKSEVVTICSRQSAGAERLQSTAMILITIEAPCRRVGIGFLDGMTCRCPVQLDADPTIRREDTVVYRASLPN